MNVTKFVKNTIRSICLGLGVIWSLQSAAMAGNTIVVWGDSLSSAYNIPVESGWVSLLQDRVENRDIKVVNGSVPGETSQGGAQRIDRALQDYSPKVLILALGSNDGLQGKDPAELESNLAYIIEQAQSAGARVLLLGMQVPPNYGQTYSSRFGSVYSGLAGRYDVGFVPLFLEPIALEFDYFQADGLHPTDTAQVILLDHIWPELENLLESADS